MTPIPLTERMLDQQAAAIGCEWKVELDRATHRWLLSLSCGGVGLYVRFPLRTKQGAYRLAWAEMARAGEAWRRTRVTAGS